MKINTYISKRLLLVILLFGLTSCQTGLTSLYFDDYTLSNETAKSTISKMNVNVPKGWFVAEDNEKHNTDIWLIKDDYSASLNFMVINLDSLSKAEIRDSELSGLKEISILFKKAKFGDKFKGVLNEESFEVVQKPFIAYEYFDSENRKIRSVLFKYGSLYYEVAAIPFNSSLENVELFKVQNSILKSIK